jgi:hypothetical protein
MALLHKLVISNCYLYITKIIVSLFSGRSFQVSVNKTDSATHSISCGVPQGAILSSTLYNFFTADSPQSNESEAATFADDIAIFVSSGDLGVVCDILQRHDSLYTRPRQYISPDYGLQGNCQLLISGLGAILSHGPQK